MDVPRFLIGLGLVILVFRFSQEMKSRTFVPHVVCLGRFPGGQARHDTPNFCAARALPCLAGC
jgi:hypothetical protein